MMFTSLKFSYFNYRKKQMLVTDVRCITQLLNCGSMNILLREKLSITEKFYF
jgi:hypothetical protein